MSNHKCPSASVTTLGDSTQCFSLKLLYLLKSTMMCNFLNTQFGGDEKKKLPVQYNKLVQRLLFLAYLFILCHKYV